MSWIKRHRFQCYKCEKFVDEGVYIKHHDGEVFVCIRCFLSDALHETIRDILLSGKEEDIRDVVRVLKGVNELIEDNPLVQGIRHVIDLWFNKYPSPIFMSNIIGDWPYKINPQRIVDYLVHEQIFSISQESLVPGEILKKLIKLYVTNKSIFTDIAKVVTGLATVRFLVDPNNPKLRSIFAVLQALRSCLDEAIPYYKVKGYRCKLCGMEFATRYDIMQHIQSHGLMDDVAEISDDLFQEYVEEIKGEVIGYLCRELLFIEKASTYGVHRTTKYLRKLITHGAVLATESDHAVVEMNGNRYIVVDASWMRIRERMRNLERQIIRQR